MQVDATRAASAIATIDPSVAESLARAADLKKYKDQRGAVKKLYGNDPEKALGILRGDLKRFHDDKIPGDVTAEQRTAYKDAFNIAKEFRTPVKEAADAAAKKAALVKAGPAQRPPSVAYVVAKAANDGIATVRTFVQQKIDDGTVDHIVKTGEQAIDAISQGFAAGRDWLRNVSRKN